MKYQIALNGKKYEVEVELSRPMHRRLPELLLLCLLPRPQQLPLRPLLHLPLPVPVKPFSLPCPAAF